MGLAAPTPNFDPDNVNVNPEPSHACGRAHRDTAPDAIDAIAKELLSDRRRSSPSNTAIGVALENGRLRLLRTNLGMNGMEFTYTDECGRNFLRLAASTRNYAVVKLIYTKFSTCRLFQVDTLDGRRATALNFACRYLSYQADMAIIVVLLDAGVDPTLKDIDGLAPLMRARYVSPGLWDAHVRPIFAARRIIIPATVDNTRSTLLSNPGAGNLQAFRAFLEGSLDPIDPEADRYNGSTLLWQAIFLEHSHGRNFVEYLIPGSQHFLSATKQQVRMCAQLAVDRNSLETLRSSPTLESTSIPGASGA